MTLCSFTVFQHDHSFLAGGSNPSQSSNLADTCATSPCLFSIPAFDRIAALCNRHFNSKREYAYAKDCEVRLGA